MDVITTFLNGNLEKEAYMKQPKGFIKLVCKSKKLIYVLNQAPRHWYLKINNIITTFSFIENVVDHCINLKVSGSKFTILVLYVDNILLASDP